MISTLARRSCAASTPSSDTLGGGRSRWATTRISGVSAIDSTTMAVMLALTSVLITPSFCASAYSTKANSPPCIISSARSKAS